MIPQFGESFLDLAPAAKLALFSQIMGLDYWLDRSQDAALLVQEVLASRVLQEQALAKYEGQVETTKADIIDLDKSFAGFASVQAVAVQQIKAELKQLGPVNDKEIKDLQRVLLSLDARIKKAAKKAANCPTCGQPISNKDLDVLTKNRAEFERELLIAQQKQKHKHTRQADLQARLATEAKRANPYSQMLEQKVQALDHLKKGVKHAKRQIDALNEEHAAVNFWVGGFKRVRLFIIEDTLRQLELEVNNNLASLGLLDWRVEFDVERENKSGGVTKGFTVFVHAPDHDEPVRFEAWSGGETQRLRLAADLGLANLIMERAGLSGAIEFYDEPSSHLSQEGLGDLAETLAQRARGLGKVIFVADHHMIEFPFADVVTVIKDLAGSRLATGT
jgi:DNA repair exonuclease SbcCD ATPase subunit